MPFNPIQTQEEFDAAIKDRLARERKSAEEAERSKYADYATIKGQVADLTKDKDALSAQLEEAKKNLLAEQLRGHRLSAAVANNLPVDLADRISGDTKEAIDADAKTLAGFFAQSHQAPPLVSSEPAPDAGGSGYSAQDAALLALAKSL